MPQSLSKVLVHIVFSTKDRKPYLRDVDVREQMFVQLGGASKTLDCQPVIVGGIADHIHLLAQQSRTIAIADWVKELKRVTSIWIKEISSKHKSFAWQAGYGAFSVSQSQIKKVIEYIKDQEKHHRSQDFKTEYKNLLERHRIPYDEQYMWD